MNEIKCLNHALTPQCLLQINAEIKAILGSNETDTARLADLIDQRHIQITEQLSMMPASKKRAFAQLENPINEYLNTFISAMLKESSDVLHNIRVGRNAVKKYNQAY
ncbi:hypothetical protein [Glaciecola sp. KUL10]|uniref:hypothetical protein n=1 Tax=Glaciecola sp. (strain KUL10) TaxID=2161813 RepID=UPI000D78C665|nr:hypothetical protein [Glaciecola sp. KUL10]GBL04056.1 hypothetical protein KUL10_13610 [Glaciecola sp. KUL10]